MNGRVTISGKWERVYGVALISPAKVTIAGFWLASSFLGLKESGADRGEEESEGLEGIMLERVERERQQREDGDGGMKEGSGRLRGGADGWTACKLIELWLRNGS